MYIPSKQQSSKSGNRISIDYIVNDFKSGTANNEYLSLSPTNFDYNSNEDWRWEGKDWNNNEIFATCRKGSTSDVTFSENYPFTFKEETAKEIERILKRFN